MWCRKQSKAFDRLRGGPGHVLPGVAVAVAVVTLPLAARPAAVRPFLTQLDPALPGVLGALRRWLLALGLALVAAALVVTRGDPRSRVEVCGVALAALLAPPLVAFGVWFGAWHAPRHLVRLLALQRAGSGRDRAARLARGAAWPTAVAVAGLAGLVEIVGAVPQAVLVGLLALTVPHVVVVAGLDARRRPWPGQARPSTSASTSRDPANGCAGSSSGQCTTTSSNPSSP